MFLGETERLDALYHVARVVAAPVVAGTGMPIKVLDALQRGAAVSATSFIDAAGKFRANGFPLFDGGHEMASDIEMLLTSEGARLERVRRGTEYFRKLCSLDRYRSAWNAIVRRLGVVSGQNVNQREGVES
jgi:hypothetical protein